MKNKRAKLPKEYYLEEVANYDPIDARHNIEAALSIVNKKIISPFRVIRFRNETHQEVFNDIYNYLLDKESQDMEGDLMFLMEEAGFFG